MRIFTFISFLVAASILPIFTPAGAVDTVNINNPAVTPGETAEQCYADAAEHLRKGMWYERAATQLKEAIRQDPKNADYHLALGCAYADRAASLDYAFGYASYYNTSVAQYPKDLADWEKAQKDPKSDSYSTPRPIAPPKFVAYTKDDLEPFTLTAKEASSRISELSKEAQAEWKVAIALEKDAQARAKAEYVQGWGLDMLASCRDFQQGIVSSLENDAPKNEIGDLPTMDDARAAFTAATKDDPNNAIYWQSLGDALGPPDEREPDPDEGAASNQVDPATHGIPSIAAYRHALSLNPKNALLWWYISQFEITTDPSKSVEDLKQAIASDQTNAYPMYFLADAELRQTHYINNHRENADVDSRDFLATEKVDKDMEATLTDQDKSLAQDAIQQVERGNEAPFCRYPMYHPPVPGWLSEAYDYMGHFLSLFPAYAQQRALARDLCGYTDVAALNGDLITAFDVDRDIVDMGKRTIGDWSMTDDWKSGHILIGQLVGIAIAAIGYADMVRIAQHYGDQGMADAVQAESDAFKAQQTQWRDVLRQNDWIDQDLYANY